MSNTDRANAEEKYLDELYKLINLETGSISTASMKAFELIQLHKIADNIDAVRNQMYRNAHGF